MKSQERVPEEIEFVVEDYHLRQSFSINSGYKAAVQQIERRIARGGRARDAIDEIATTKFRDSEVLEVWGPLRSKTKRGSRCKLGRFQLHPKDWLVDDLNQAVRQNKAHGDHQMTATGIVRSGVIRGAITGFAFVPRPAFDRLTSMLGRAPLVLVQVSGKPIDGEKDSSVSDVQFTCLGQHHALDCSLLDSAAYACDCKGSLS